MKNLGLATVGIVSLKKEVLESEDFLAAKQGSDIDAATRVIDKVWKSKKSDQLKNNIVENTVFLSMPSTTKQNILPAMMAIKFSDDFDCPFVYGDDLFNTLHGKASKKIARDKRVFNPREYSVADPEGVSSQLKGKNVVLVDDVITTGSSIRHFTEFLRKHNIWVNHVACLMGDRRLALDTKTEKKLDLALQEKGVDIQIDTINHITRSEAGGLLRRLNGLRGENGLRKFTEDLQRIQRKPSLKSAQGYSRGRKYCQQRGDRGVEQLCERVQTYSCSSTGIEDKKSKLNFPSPSMIAYGVIDLKTKDIQIKESVPNSDFLPEVNEEDCRKKM